MMVGMVFHIALTPVVILGLESSRLGLVLTLSPSQSGACGYRRGDRCISLCQSGAGVNHAGRLSDGG